MLMSDLSSLEQKKKILAQKKARLQKYEALLKAQERKEKLSHRIKVGELAEKAGIDKLDPDVLLGAFIDLSKRLNNETEKDRWKQLSRDHNQAPSLNSIS